MRITLENQFKNKANFLNKNGELCLVRCFACEGYEERGRENYTLNVPFGVCTWCGWTAINKELQNNKKD